MRMFFLRGGPEGQEALDQPITNFDVIGIPTGRWSSSLLACFDNLAPSCIMSCFFPCIQWGQVVVRAQIPLLIGLKNSLPCWRGNSGYGLFVEYFFWSAMLTAGLILLAILVHLQKVWLAVVVIALLVAGGALLVLLGHTRTAFKEK